MAVIGMLFFPAVSAQEPGEPDVKDGCETLDETVYLCDATLEGDTAHFEIVATDETTVALGDSSVFIEGGQVEVQEFPIEADTRTTISIELNEYDGYYGAFLATEDGYFHPEVFEDRRALLPGQPSTSDIWISVGTTAFLFVIGGPIAYIGVRKMRGEIRRVF
ncbi:hypothetical protein [Natrarchaeobius versutus]|uniref:hypothetical protein n=1 Tax=Natrarchaeobius versutus TaxID=1679078 RepID=UPI00350F4391